MTWDLRVAWPAQSVSSSVASLLARLFGRASPGGDSQGRPREAAHRESIGPAIKAAFGGPFIANEGFTFESARKALAEAKADAVAFGKLFIANPDLVERFARHAPLNAWDTATFYVGGEKGYVDYPALQSDLASVVVSESAG